MLVGAANLNRIRITFVITIYIEISDGDRFIMEMQGLTPKHFEANNLIG
jgi:hypothetical protein